MNRWIATLSLPLCLLFVGCDSEPVDERSGESALLDVDADEVEANADEANADGDRRSAKRGRKGPPAQRLCAALDCSEEQTAAITELFAKNRPAKADREAKKEKRAEHRSALAEAFRAGTLSADDMTRDRPAKSGSKRGEMLAELHALLTPDQREQVSDMIAEHGPRLFSGKGKRGGKGMRGGKGKRGDKGERSGKGKRGDKARGERVAKDHDGGERGAHGEKGPRIGKKIERLCAKVECTEEQLSTLVAQATELHQGAKGDREAKKAEHEAKKAERAEAKSALATAFRGDTFSTADLEGFGARGAEKREAKGQAKAQAKGAMVLALQEVLTTEQRALVADMIAERGLQSIMGGKRGKHSKKGKRGRGGPEGKRGRHGKQGDKTSEGASDHA